MKKKEKAASTANAATSKNPFILLVESNTTAQQLSAITCCEIPGFRCHCAADETLRSLRFYRNLRAELILEGESVPIHIIQKIAELERVIQVALTRQRGDLAA